MAEGLNKVMLLGNLGADPELKTTAGGPVLKLRLATTESFLDKSNTRQERTEWHSVTLFGKRAEALARFLQKGERVFVEGAIRTSSYEKDGEKRYRTEVIASNVILNGRGDSSTGETARPAGGMKRAGAQRSPAPPVDDFGDYPGGDDDVPF